MAYYKHLSLKKQSNKNILKNLRIFYHIVGISQKVFTSSLP